MSRRFAVAFVTSIAFSMASVPLASIASAAEVSISGTHSQDEIKGTCAKEGGNFYSNAHGVYGCSKNGNTVECTANETCKGYTAELQSPPSTSPSGKNKVLDLLQTSPTTRLNGTAVPATKLPATADGATLAQ